MKEIKEQIGTRNINTIGMFNFSKGVLMAFVVFGHSFSLFVKYWERETMPGWMILPFVAFGLMLYGLIPMFFMINGYGFRKQKMKRCIEDRARYFLKPYLWVTGCVALLVVIKAVLQNKSIAEAVKYQVVPFFLGLCPGETWVYGWHLGCIGPMWFLVALGLARIVLNLAFQIKNDMTRVLFLVALIAVCTQLPFYAFMPFCLAQSVCGAGYLYLGYCVKKNQLLTKKLSGQTYAVLIAICISAFLFGTVDVSQNVWKLGFFDYIASGVAGFLLCKILLQCERFEGKIANVFRLLGRNSLYIFCIHTIEYLVFPWGRVTELFTGHAWLGVIVVLVMRVIIIGVGCVAVHGIVKMKRNRAAR